MKTFFCETDIYNFRSDAQEIRATDARIAAELYACMLFDEGDMDTMRPLDVIVAKDRNGTNAKRFEVRRTITVEDDAREIGEVELPADDEESEG